MTAVAGGARVPGYLGRVLDGDGDPAGTCFQVAAGILVTAWHVLDTIGAVMAGEVARVDPLAGGEPFDAVVARLDPVYDLAVLVSRVRLAECAGPPITADRVTLREPVSMTGHCVADDARQVRFLTAVGQWAGLVAWDDAVLAGRVTADAVLPGMSGAPVIRDRDGAVAGVVSGRYNAADVWLAGTVWVARSEDLMPLLDALADVTIWDSQPGRPVEPGWQVPPVSERVDAQDLTAQECHADAGQRPEGKIAHDASARVSSSNSSALALADGTGFTAGEITARAALPHDLLASYRLDEMTGWTAADEVGGNTLRLSGAVRWGGEPGSGLTFGGDRNLDCTSDNLIATDQSFSVSAWVMLNDTGRTYFRTAVAQDGDLESGFYLQYSNWPQERTWAFVMSGPKGARAVAREPPRTGAWVHLVGVHDADARELRLYVDGQREDHVPVLSGRRSSGRFTIGRALYGGEPVDFFDGSIKQVKAWNRALSDIDVSVLARTTAPLR